MGVDAPVSPDGRPKPVRSDSGGGKLIGYGELMVAWRW